MPLERLRGTLVHPVPPQGVGDVALRGVTCGVTLPQQWHWGHQVSPSYVQAVPAPSTLCCWQVCTEMLLLFQWGAAFVRLKSPGPGQGALAPANGSRGFLPVWHRCGCVQGDTAELGQGMLLTRGTQCSGWGGQAPRGSSCTASPRAPSQLGTRPRAPADGVAGRKCLMKRSGVICLG